MPKALQININKFKPTWYFEKPLKGFLNTHETPFLMLCFVLNLHIGQKLSQDLQITLIVTFHIGSRTFGYTSKMMI